MPRVDVLTDTLIQRPVSQVAVFAGDPDNAPLWYENIKTVEWLSPRPLRIGSRVAFVAKFLGRRLSYTYEFVELVPERKLVMRTAEGPFPMETTYEWQSDSAGTRMTLRNRGEPTGFARLASPILSLAMRRANRKDLRRLKELLESSSPAPAGGA
jgi:hypothetical protein